MKKSRLEAFSDGVIAIIITIMVLELKLPPHGHADIKSLLPLAPFFLAYVLSFVNVGIYWNNHHHMLYLVSSITGGALWANLMLLFWLSLIPFGTEWMADNHFAAWPVAVYGMILIMCALSYTLLTSILVSHCARQPDGQGKNSELADAIGRDWKGKLSLVIYAVAVATAFFNPLIACGLYVAVSCTWFIPDRRVERKVYHKNNEE
ncbi:MAG: TMEM175 family protein [Sphingobacteriales bacterium]